MEDGIKTFLAWFAGGSIVGGGLIWAAYLIFKKLSASWLDHKFAVALEQSKQDNQKELQRIKLQIDARLDRAVKLHGKEFEVLPEAWRLLDLATAAARHLSGSLVQIPPLNTMSQALFDVTLANSPFSEPVREQIRADANKEEMWGRAIRLKFIETAQTRRLEFYEYIMGKGIWIKPDLRAQFLAIDDLNIKAWAEAHTNFQIQGMPGSVPSIAASLKLGADAPALLQKLNDDIAARLWRSEVDLPP